MSRMEIDKKGNVKYGPNVVKIRKYKGWFKYEEFLIHPNESNLTMIPVVKPKKFLKLRFLWLKYAPEWFKKYKRHRSQMKFLDKLNYPKNAKIREQFGTQAYTEAEKVRVMKLPEPKTEFTGYDPKPPSKSVREIIVAAIVEHNAKADVKG